MLHCKLIEPAGIGLQQRGHLIDEGSGTASTGGIHPLLNAAAEIDNLGIFPAKLNRCIALRNPFADRLGAGNDLLDKRNLPSLDSDKPEEPLTVSAASLSGNRSCTSDRRDSAAFLYR